MTTETVSDPLGIRQEQSPLKRSSRDWSAGSVLIAYGDFLAGRSRIVQHKNPDALFAGRTFAGLCFCWLTVTSQPGYSDIEPLLRQKYKLGERLHPLEESVIERFKAQLQMHLNEHPFDPTHAAPDQEGLNNDTLIPAATMAEILGIELGTLSARAARGKIPNAQRKGQRLWIPLTYLKEQQKELRGEQTHENRHRPRTRTLEQESQGV